ncbi:putative secreted protein (Por secretion system target), partial [Leeuwenhoekiella polynyae]
TITGITGDDKEYDGTTTATATGTASLSGVETTDVVSLGGTPVFSFASADVGTGIAITTTGYTISGTDAGNYSLTQPTLAADITTKALTITGITGDDKEYDGTTTATATGTASLSGVESTDVVSLGGTPVFTFASTDVGTGIAITTTGYTISGADAGNYTLTQPTLSADITTKALTITGITGDDKEYDGTTAATASGTASLSGVETTDVVSLGGTPVFTFASADVGTGIAITTTGYTISGTDAGNYTLTQPTLSADITTKALTITGITGDNKEYDGTTAATATGTASLNGVESTDVVSLGGTPVFTFASADVGTGIGITTTGYTISGTDAGNYTLTQPTLSADITTKALTITGITGDDKEYDGTTAATATGTASLSGIESTDVVSLGGTPVFTFASADVGIGIGITTTGYTISGTDAGNYTLTQPTLSADITTKALTITGITGDDKEYDGTTAATATGTASLSGVESTDVVSLGGTPVFTFASADVGTGIAITTTGYTISGADAGNYTLTQPGLSADINPLTLVVEADAQTKVYGSADPSLTYQVTSGSLIGSDAFSGSLTRISGETVGTYEITQGSLGLNSNYDLSYISNDLTISKATITVTADNQTKIYGAADPALTVSYSGFENGDSELDLEGTLNVTRTTGESVGSYVISASGATSTNYDITYIDGDFEIIPAALTITADDQTKVYGESDPALTVSYSGFENGDSESDLGGTLSVIRATGEGVGSYVISASGVTSMNYDITYVAGSFEITPAALTITADDQTKIYGESDPALTVSYSGFENGDSESDLGGTLNISRTSGEAVGSYVISVSGATSMNYSITYIDGNFEITPAALTITADDQTKVYGESDPDLTVSYSGFENGDSESDLGGTLSVIRATGEGVGSYVISASGATSMNYSITYVAGSFEITPAALTITADDQTKVYGESDPALTVSYSGFENGDSESDLGGTLSVIRATGEAVGSYVISASGATSMNYDITYVAGSFEITPTALTITADDQTKVYGESDPALTVSYSGFENGDSESDLGGALNVTRTTGESVGSYVISASGATSMNYDITYVAGSFEITPAALTITADDQTKVYGAADPALTVSYSGFENGDSESDLGGTLNISRTIGESVGSYVISASGATSTNYDVTYIDGDFEITPASQTITFNPLPVLNLESDDDFQLQAVASSGLPVSYSYTYTSDVPAAMVSADGFVSLVQSGNIVITASQSGNENYSPATPVSQELEITSSEASIRSLFIGDEVFTNPDSQIIYVIDCDETAQELVVSYETEENAESDSPKSFTVDVSKPGIYRYAITISSQDGTNTMTYNIEIHKRFIFDEIVVQKFNNTLLVNNNPATNGGYRFVAFTWYKNGNVVGNGQYFSEGDEATDMLDPLANYSVTLTTEEGDVLSTCDFTIELDVSSKIKLAPNPVQVNASTTLFANFEKEELKNMKVSILTMSGTLIDTFYTSSSKSTIQMPASIQAGVYILVCETSRQTQTVQFIVH